MGKMRYDYNTMNEYDTLYRLHDNNKKYKKFDGRVKSIIIETRKGVEGRKQTERKYWRFLGKYVSKEGE